MSTPRLGRSLPIRAAAQTFCSDPRTGMLAVAPNEPFHGTGGDSLAIPRSGTPQTRSSALRAPVPFSSQVALGSHLWIG